VTRESLFNEPQPEATTLWRETNPGTMEALMLPPSSAVAQNLSSSPPKSRPPFWEKGTMLLCQNRVADFIHGVKTVARFSTNPTRRFPGLLAFKMIYDLINDS
jgi:hypothetical protein